MSSKKTVLVSPVVGRYGNRRDLLGYERLFYGNPIFPLPVMLCLVVRKVAQIALLLTQRKKRLREQSLRKMNTFIIA